MTGKIVNIKRFAVHDGNGIRTTVFLKGCPLKCKWCHNPEGISLGNQLAYYSVKCINCGECVSVCPNNAHYMEKDKHLYNRDLCKACGKCQDVCLGKALVYYGTDISSDELLKILLEDKDFYKSTNGGVTLSGGEPLMQADFCYDLLVKLKDNSINTAVDTCGFVNYSVFEKILPYTDMFLYDIKGINEEKHIRNTGVSNKLILENIKKLDKSGAKIEVRIPFIPGYNSDEMESIGLFLSSLTNVCKVKVLPYHNYSISRYTALGLESTLTQVSPPSVEMLCDAVKVLKGFGLNAISG